MRHIIPMVFATLVFTTAGTALAEQGSYSSALRTMLTKTAAGTCPADLMADQLFKACKDQMPKLKPEMTAAGPIKSITFVEADTVKGQRVETYKVTFAKGAPETWHIGNLRDGKFQNAYNNGD